MSSVETPPPPTPVERRCPRCDARLSAEQEWCLECGAAVGTRIAEPRGWRASLAVVGVLLALALIAVVLAIVELSRDAEGVQEVARTPTPAAATPPPDRDARARRGGRRDPDADASPVPTPRRRRRRRAAARARPPASPSGPRASTAWTVVLNSSGTREDAERLAGELAAKGVPDVGVIDSDDFESLGPGLVRGLQRHLRPASREAQAALAKVRDQAGGGSTRRIVPAK